MKTLKVPTLSVALFAIGLSFTHPVPSLAGGTGYGGGEEVQPTIPKNARNGLTVKDLEGMFQRCLLTGSPLSKTKPFFAQFYENVYGQGISVNDMIQVDYGSGQDDNHVLPNPQALPLFEVTAIRKGEYKNGTYQFETAGAGVGIVEMRAPGAPLPNENGIGNINEEIKFPWLLLYQHMFSLPKPPLGGQRSATVELYNIPNEGAVTELTVGPLGSFSGTLAVEKSVNKWGTVTENQERLLNIKVNVATKAEVRNASSNILVSEIDLTDYRNCLNSELQAATTTAGAGVKNTSQKTSQKK